MNQPPETTTAVSSPQRVAAEDPAAKGAGILERYSGLPSFSGWMAMKARGKMRSGPWRPANSAIPNPGLERRATCSWQSVPKEFLP